MSKYSEEEMKLLADMLSVTLRKLNLTDRWRKLTNFIWKLREVNYNYSFFRRKSYKGFMVFQKLLRLPLSKMPLYANIEEYKTIVKWRLFLAEPLENMPLYINDPLCSDYAVNRIRVGK